MWTDIHVSKNTDNEVFSERMIEMYAKRSEAKKFGGF